MAVKKEVRNVGYTDSQGNYRSFVNNYDNTVGYTDSQGNWRGAPPASSSNSTTNSINLTSKSELDAIAKQRQDEYNRILNLRNEMLASKGYDSKGNPINNNNNTAATSYPVPTYQQPNAIREYNWGDGSEYLQPDNPLVRPVVYENEFSPESTIGIAQDVYNQYYDPIVKQQQQQVIQQYNDTAARSSAMMGAYGMSTGSSGAVQLRNQANREAAQTNLAYQQQMQLQAFQDTLNARQLELNNKIQDYQNAWEEVSQYGYVVTENTGNLLGIEPGKQLTTLNYKSTMSNIAKNVADINAQKVQLNQAQQQLDQAWAAFQEGIRQYEKDFAEGQRQFNLGYELDKQQLEINRSSAAAQNQSSIYQRLVDMLGRYDTVTPEMASLGSQVGMNLTVGSSTSNYLNEAERYQYNQAAKGNQQYYNKAQLQALANSYLPIVQSSGRINNSSQFASLLAQWASQGASAKYVSDLISKSGEIEVAGVKYNLKDIVGTSSEAKQAAQAAAYSILGQNGASYNDYKNYQYASTGESLGTLGGLGGLGLAAVGAATLNPFLFFGGLAGATASSVGSIINSNKKKNYNI